MPGGCSGAASGGWRSGRAPRCSRPSPTSASSWWTRSTRPATRTVRRRAITRGRWRRCGHASKARAWCWGVPRHHWSPWSAPISQLRLLRLPERIGARRLPPVELLDLRVAPKVEGTGAVPWSQALDQAIVETLARGEQALLLLNRRGYAAFLHCPDCGEVWQCPRCNISLTVHSAPAGLRCHYCGHEEPIPYTCRVCANPVQQMRGVGTQQLERVLGERYPRRPDRADGSGHDQHQVVPPADPRAGGVRRGGSAARHADDRQGARLPQRDAGRGRGRGYRPVPPRLPFGRADLPTAGAGGGAGRKGAKGREECWCRPGIRGTTRSSVRRSTTPRDFSSRSASCGGCRRIRRRPRW